MTAIDKAAKRDLNLCRVCGIPLLTSAERKIGVHISCVSESRFRQVNIPTPKYGVKDGRS